MKRLIIEIIGAIVGAGVMASGISFFLLPNQLSSGGFSGVATIIYYLFKMPMGQTILLLNIPIFLFAIYKLGKKFFIKALVGTISLACFIDFFDKLPYLTQDRFLACIYGGILIGLGTAIILKVNASTGGTELISNIVREYNESIRISTIMTIIDIIIVVINMIFFKEIEVGLYSTISIYLIGKMIDIIFEGIYFTKLLIIISDKNEKIAEEIGRNLKRGTTGLYGKGMYTDKEKLVLICVAARGDVSRVRQIAKKIDSKSFIIISNAREVFGEGFKNH